MIKDLFTLDLSSQMSAFSLSYADAIDCNKFFQSVLEKMSMLPHERYFLTSSEDDFIEIKHT